MIKRPCSWNFQGVSFCQSKGESAAKSLCNNPHQNVYVHIRTAWQSLHSNVEGMTCITLISLAIHAWHGTSAQLSSFYLTRWFFLVNAVVCVRG
eukprot:c29359_g1_i1 orf=387-668(-)